MSEHSLRARCEQARDQLRAGEYDRAIAHCRALLKLYPKYVPPYTIMGEAYLAKGEHAEAANLFRRALGANPEATIPYAGLGLIYEERGLLEEAIWQLERAFELAPHNKEIRASLLDLYTQRDAAPPSRRKLSRAGLARVYARGHLYPKAIGEFRDLLRKDPMRMDLRVALAEALWRNGHYAGASVVCRGILDLAPNCLKANLILGEIYLRDKDREADGRALLDQAQMLDPENVVAQSLFGDRSPLAPRIVPVPPHIVEGLAETEEAEVVTEAETIAEPEPLEEVAEVAEAEKVEEPEPLEEAAEAAEAEVAHEPATVAQVGEVGEAEAVEEVADAAEAETVKEPKKAEEVAQTAEAEVAEEVAEVAEPEVAEEAARVAEVGEAEAVEEVAEAAEAEVAEEAAIVAEVETVEEPAPLEEAAEAAEAEAVEEARPLEEVAEAAEAEAVEEPEPLEELAEAAEAEAVEETRPLEEVAEVAVDEVAEEAGIVAEADTVEEPEKAEEAATVAEAEVVEEARPLEETAEAEIAEEAEVPAPLSLAEEAPTPWAALEAGETSLEVSLPLEDVLTPLEEIAEMMQGESETPPEAKIEWVSPLGHWGEPSLDVSIQASDLSLPGTPTEGPWTPPADEETRDFFVAKPQPGVSRIESLRQRVMSDPTDCSARLKFARAYWQGDQLAQALEEYRPIATRPSDVLDRVINDLEEITAREPANLVALELLGEAYAQANRSKDALTIYRQLYTDLRKPSDD